MWKFLLILAVVQASAKEKQQKVHGCSTAFRYKPLNTFDPFFDEDPLPMKFNNTVELVEMVKKIHTVYTELMEKFIFNNVPEFFDMYNKFMNLENPSSICYLFNQEFIDTSSPTFVMELIKEIVKISANVKEHWYRVQSELSYQTSRGFNKIPLEVLHHKMFLKDLHISGAAAIRIEVEKRKGVILMDDGHSFFGPILIMDDLKYPHLYFSKENNQDPQIEPGEKLNTPEGHNIFYQIGQKMVTTISRIIKNKGNKFVLLNATTDEIYSLRIPENGIALVKKYDVKKNSSNYDKYYTVNPSCKLSSFILRHELLTAIKKIYRRDSKGNLKASISFDMHSNDPEFTMMFKDNHTKFELNIKFYERKRLNETEMQIYDAVISEFESMDIEWILRKAERIASNKNFMDKYQKNKMHLRTYGTSC